VISHLYLPDCLETVSLTEGRAPRACRFEISG
jgi:hypothetical protein